MSPQIWWYVSRASGLVAWGLLTLAMCWGIALSTRVFGRRAQPMWLQSVHRFLGGLSVWFVLLHIVGIVGDNDVPFGRADMLVPMASQWRPGAVAWGIVAFYLLLAVELTSLMMKRLPKRVWRGIHLTSFGLYVMASLHTVLAGHDAHSIVFRVIALTLVQGVMFLTLVRLIAGRASWPVERRARERRAGERAWTPEERVADRARALATRPQEETAPTSGRSV